MSPVNLGLVGDGLLALLLVVVIGFAIQLNRRLSAWRQESGAMEQQIATLTAALIRAEQALGTMKGIARDEVAALDAAQKKAQSLRDDLAFLQERGAALADRLEQAVRQGLTVAAEPPRAAVAPAPSAAPSPAPSAPVPAAAMPPRQATPKPETERAMSNAERELLKALEAMR